MLLMKKRSLLFALLLAWGYLTLLANQLYTIYPIPHQQIAGKGSADFSPQVTVVCDELIDQATRQRALQVLQSAGLKTLIANRSTAEGSQIYLAVAGGHGAAISKADALQLDQSVLNRSGKFDRHLLHLYQEDGKAQLVILGEHSDAVFYGLASLEQMLERGTDNLPCVTLQDYADQQSRGLVEGYYGYPYTVAVKKDLMRFMMRLKMNTYMYGAKSDVYHSASWEKPYPSTITAEQRKNGLLTQADVRDIAATSAATKVNFIWAIHPGNDFVHQPSVVNRIMSKFDSMYQLGVRQFAVFVDDVGVPTSEADCKTNADRLTAVQQAIDNKWNLPTATPEQRVKPLHFVPQVYTLNWVGEAERKRFYKALQSCPDKITIYITGSGVWSVPNSGDLAVTKRELGRNVAWWWNYPCNDNADEQIYPSDMYTNFMEMRSVNNHARMPKLLQNAQGIVSNPMQQGEVSKTALFSVADYAWNNSGFNNQKSWEASFTYILNSLEKQTAYKTLVPYLRWNDPTEMQSAISAYKAGNRTPMKQLLGRLSPAIRTLKALKTSDIESDRLLHTDLSPWLSKLEAMVAITEQMMTSAESTEKLQQWQHYVQAVERIASLDTAQAFTAYALEGLGHGISVSQRQCAASAKHFFPFMSYLGESGLGKHFFGQTRNEMEVVKSHPQLQAQIQLSQGQAYLLGTGMRVPVGGYVGFALKEAVRPVRIEADAPFLAQHNILYSANGKNWKRLESTNLPQDDYLKYVVYQNNTQAEQNIDFSKVQLSITLPQLIKPANIVVPLDQAGGGGSNSHLGSKAIIDGNPNTFFACNKNQAQGDTYLLTLAEPTTVKDVRVYFGMLNEDWLQAGRLEVSPDGKNWFKLKVRGTNLTIGGIDQAKDYAPEVKYIDFVGDVAQVKQLRLVVTNPKTNKWLRLYDIQVNPEYTLAQYAPIATDAHGYRLTALTDQKGNSAIETAQGGSLTYKFQQLQALSQVAIYWNQQGGEVQVELWDDKSESWIAYGHLQEALHILDLSAHKNVLKMRLSWKGNRLPGIYEIEELSDEQSSSILAGISPLHKPEWTEKSLHIYDLNGRLLRTDGQTTNLPAGLYVVDGRIISLQ